MIVPLRRAASAVLSSATNLQKLKLPAMIACFLLLIVTRMHGQGSALLSATPGPPALSASSETLEMPLLVVDHEHRPVSDIGVKGMMVKTGTGAEITPIAIRREEEDPISLAILLDASRDSWHDLSEVGDDLEALVGSQLFPRDRVSMYAFDCSMTRSLTDAVPAAGLLRKGVTDALTFPTLHGGQSHSACGKTVHLWDDVAIAVSKLSHAPGRRVLLLLSSGADGGSKYDSAAIQQYAFDQGVAIFALRDRRQVDADDFTRLGMSTHRGVGSSGPSISPTLSPRAATGMELLCANDGGVTLSAEPQFRRDAIADILFLVRERFILTLPKEAYPAGGAHSAKVTPGGLLTPFFFSATGAVPPVIVKAP